MAASSAFTLSAAAAAQSLTSRELVDVEFVDSGALTVLISAPGARSPGIYRWPHDASAPDKLCTLTAPASFSFDRRFVFERVRGEALAAATLHVYDPRNCRRLTSIRIAGGRIVDADVRDRQIAVATRDADGNRKLRLYSFRGRQLAETTIGANVEIGFAPDGKSLLNFDLSDQADAGRGIWAVPRLTRAAAPAWASADETTFVPGARFVKRYAGDSLSVVRWPDGRRLYTVAASPNVRLRSLSGNGRYGLLHQRQEQNESLDWIDFATGRRLTLASGPQGNIDHASIDLAGRMVAWSERSTDDEHRVSIRRQMVDGNASPPMAHAVGTMDNGPHDKP